MWYLLAILPITFVLGFAIRLAQHLIFGSTYTVRLAEDQ